MEKQHRHNLREDSKIYRLLRDDEQKFSYRVVGRTEQCRACGLERWEYDDGAISYRRDGEIIPHDAKLERKRIRQRQSNDRRKASQQAYYRQRRQARRPHSRSSP